MIDHWATKYIGIPYKLGEMDCWGLFRRIQNERYGRDVPMVDLLAGRNWRKVDEPQDGDAIYMHPSHVGIYVVDGDNKGVLHTDEGFTSRYTPMEYMWSYGYVMTGIYRWIGK